MFRGDDQSLRAVLTGAYAEAHRLGHRRVGSEHLLLALAQTDATLAPILSRHGATLRALRNAASAAAPHGAGAAADRVILAPLGIDGPLPPTEHPAGRPPRFPLGATRARRRLTNLGADAQAAYEASLRLALARREHTHRAEHLALALLCLDPGVAWTLAAAGANRETLLAELSASFPARARIGWRTRARQRELVRRYQMRTGRAVVDGGALMGLVG